MLFHDDVMTDGQAQPGTLAGGFRGEKRIEHLFLYLGGNAGAIVANYNLDTIAEVFCRSGEGRLVAATIGLRLALGRGVETVRDQVEQHPRDLLREQIDFAGSRIEGPLDRDIEPLPFGPSAVIGEIEALF